jgi:hypothetical protein
LPDPRGGAALAHAVPTNAFEALHVS